MGNSSFARHPFLLGFEQLDRLTELSAKNDGYPPYNIEQVSENAFRISLAVAGFSEDDLEIVLSKGELTIKGVQSDSVEDKVFLHRGIAARQFKRAFVLAEGVDVEHAYMENGLLHIELKRNAPKQRAHRIEINRR